jgi:hypothetical protein
MILVWPAREYLASYVAALERGWWPDNVRREAAAREQLDTIARDLDQPSHLVNLRVVFT